tara:strand:+ start:1706 stop:2641 length:936 start_codon:yes stop_codon:yes gene_type:complete
MPAKKKATGKTTTKKTARKTASKAKKTATKKATSKDSSSNGKKVGGVSEEVARQVATGVLRKRGRKQQEDDSRKGQPVVFSLEDVREFLKNRKATGEEEIEVVPKKKVAAAPAKPKAPAPAATAPARPKQSFGAASVADLLGFDPTASGADDSANKSNEEDIPKKFLTYYRALVELHEQVYEGLHRHSEETLRRSNKEDSGDLSSYGQHMADAGTDSFDRDFALSMVSSEQEALYEIDEAIRRIRDGSYGVCEITGKPISRDRLRAVPFTRYSVEGQMEVERGRKRTVQKAGIQGFDGEDSPVMSDDDSDE